MSSHWTGTTLKSCHFFAGGQPNSLSVRGSLLSGPCQNALYNSKQKINQLGQESLGLPYVCGSLKLRLSLSFSMSLMPLSFWLQKILRPSTDGVILPADDGESSSTSTKIPSEYIFLHFTADVEVHCKVTGHCFTSL